MHYSKLLDTKGASTVYIKWGKHDTKRAIVVVTIAAAGKTHNAMVIFKGVRNGCIVKCEFPSYIAGSLYACQENASMDEAYMLQ